MIVWMMNSVVSGKRVKGVKGLSPFAGLAQFDLVWSWCVDYMHTVCLGCMRHLIFLWIESEFARKYVLDGVSAVKVINGFLASMKLTKNITRAPKNIQDFKNWKASELRGMLLLFGVPAMQLVLKTKYFNNFRKISEAIFLLCQSSISETEFVAASKLIISFLIEFECLYGEKHMLYNFHLLQHIPLCVLNCGPLWVYSTFGYETKNHFLNKFINGTNNVVQEAATKLEIYQGKFLGKRMKTLNNRKFSFRIEDTLITTKPYKSYFIFDQRVHIYFEGVLREVRYFYHNSVYYEKFEGKLKKSDDSYLETVDGIFGRIEKIVVNENYDRMGILIELKYNVEKQVGQFKYVVLKEAPERAFIYSNQIKSKVIFFESCLMFTHIPNNLESD